MPTHDVTNQAPPLIGANPAEAPSITDALRRAGVGDAAIADVSAVGALAGSEEAIGLGNLAEAHPPVLHTHDRHGNRIDEVVYDPAYHRLMAHAVDFGLHGAPWADPSEHAHLLRAAKFSAWSQVDAGHGCPISMTYAAVPALRMEPSIAALYEPLLSTRDYEPGLRAPLSKRGLIAGMSMTEKQGGSDVRANTTAAHPQSDGTYSITGHKWFTSAPMSDVFLTLAQAPDGLTRFLVPRVLPDGTRNTFLLQRLKDKLGNRSNASSEVEYDRTVAWRIGDEGRGVRTIVEMVNLTRLDCVLGSASLMRIGTTQAVHHASHRSAFGARLIDQPLMQNVLADLAVEAEAATTVGLWLAELTDGAMAGDERLATLRRVALAVTKFHVCKRGPIHAAEALECLGGNGYIEDSRMPRLYREAPLLSVWEGSGNVAALDVLRALAREPAGLSEFLDEIGRAKGADARFDDELRRFEGEIRGLMSLDLDALQFGARRLVSRMAVLLQASLLIRFGDPTVADAFVASRIDDDRGDVFGTLPGGTDVRRIIERAAPRTG